jgi:hypothetical protein
MDLFSTSPAYLESLLRILRRDRGGIPSFSDPSDDRASRRDSDVKQTSLHAVSTQYHLLWYGYADPRQGKQRQETSESTTEQYYSTPYSTFYSAEAHGPSPPVLTYPLHFPRLSNMD